MKKIILILFPLLFFAINTNAQNGTSFLSFKGLYGVNRVIGGDLAYDYSTKYFSQNSIFIEYQKRDDTGYELILGGFGIRPVIARSGNTSFRFRFGIGAGTDKRKFVAAPHVGFELAQTLGPRIDLFIGNKNQVILWSPSSERWRFALDFGFRIPLN